MKSYKALIVTLVLTSLFAVAPKAFADGDCTNQYGNPTECPKDRIEINKKVRYPTNSSLFVENLTDRDASYSPGDEVEYDLAVTNTSNENYQTVTVIDVFPGVVTFVSGPGRYETNANKLTFELSDLKAGQTVHSRVLVKLSDASKFPDDLKCDIVNTATATGPGGMSDQDTASLCVRTKVAGVTTLPVAGYEDWAYVIPFLTLALIGFGILGKGALIRS